MKWSEEDVEYIKKHYSSDGLTNVSIALGRSRNSVSKYAGRHEITISRENSNGRKSEGHKRCTVDESFFSEPSKDREYVLGFIAADGVNDILGTPKTKLHIYKNGITSLLSFYGRNAMRFCEWLYADGGIRLDRKYNKFVAMKIA